MGYFLVCFVLDRLQKGMVIQSRSQDREVKKELIYVCSYIDNKKRFTLFLLTHESVNLPLVSEQTEPSRG